MFLLRREVQSSSSTCLIIITTEIDTVAQTGEVKSVL